MTRRSENWFNSAEVSKLRRLVSLRDQQLILIRQELTELLTVTEKNRKKLETNHPDLLHLITSVSARLKNPLK